MQSCSGLLVLGNVPEKTLHSSVSNGQRSRMPVKVQGTKKIGKDSKMRRPVTALVYPVRRGAADWEYLLLHRVASRGGFWQGVTGSIEEGEDLMEAARRELFEETRLVPSLIERIDYSYSFPIEDRWHHLYPSGVEKITEYVFIAHVDGRQGPEIDPVEHDGWKWCRFSKALELLTWAGNIEALKRCDSVVRTRR